jgi:hypothetical protein
LGNWQSYRDARQVNEVKNRRANVNVKPLLVAWFLATLLLGCSPADTDIKTAIAQTEGAQATSTLIPELPNTIESSPPPETTSTYSTEPGSEAGLIFDAEELDVIASPSMGSAVGDLDNDGDLDVLVVRKLDRPSIFINDGNGAFSLGEQEFPRYNLSDAGIKDLNSDGYPDIVLVQVNGPNLVLFNDGAGGFPQIAQELGNGPGMGVCIEDIDSDGDFDLFFAQYEAPLEIWFNNGAGHFDISEQGFVAANNRKFALGDLDGDGDLDAVIPRDFGESSVILLNDGTGRFESFESGLQTEGSNGINASLGDVDGDGDLDILHNCHGCGDSVWINDGSARFTSTGQWLSMGWSYDSAFVDLDRDGDLDIVIANSNIPDQVWLNDGTGLFSQATTTPEQRGSTTVEVEDFDNDGDADAFFARYNGKETVWINKQRD